MCDRMHPSVDIDMSCAGEVIIAPGRTLLWQPTSLMYHYKECCYEEGYYEEGCYEECYYEEGC